MSINCVDAAIELANENDVPMFLIANHRQIDFEQFSGGCKLFYSNLGPIIKCVEKAVIKIRVFDEAF